MNIDSRRICFGHWDAPHSEPAATRLREAVGPDPKVGIGIGTWGMELGTHCFRLFLNVSGHPFPGMSKCQRSLTMILELGKTARRLCIATKSSK